MDLSAVANFYPKHVREALKADVLNPLMSLGFDAWKEVRETTTKLLSIDSELATNGELQKM